MQHPANPFSKRIIPMTTATGPARRLKYLLLGCAAGTSLLAPPAFAQEAKRRIDGEKILELLVAKGVISQTDADGIIAQAEVVEPAAQRPPLPQAGVAADGTQTVTYVSPVVREQIAQQVRADLGSQAQAEGWSKPGETPEWTRRIRLYGDVRARGEALRFDNANSDIFENFAAMNAGDPFNINERSPDYVGLPFINTLRDRQRFQLRARLGVKAQIADWISADVRIATGNGRSPVSTNQTLGANGTSNYALWLDRAAIRLSPGHDITVDVGRFANPFWSSDLLFDTDMNFDGIAVSGRGAVNDKLAVFGTLGAFPVFNTDLNFGTQNAQVVDGVSNGRPFASQDKYLFAAQAGVEFRPTDQVELRLATGYFRFDNIQGKLSEPCYWYELVCSTDVTRPAFQQFGNTMRVVRNIVPDPSNPVTSPESQYFGLASKFEILHVRGQLDYRPNDGFGVRLDGDYVRNLAWNRRAVAARALNNLGGQVVVPNPDTPDPNDTMLVDGPYAGGNTGWQARLTLGSVLNLNGVGDWTAKRGDWNAWGAYRRLESDAVVDAFADSDFHIGGTNNRGWQIGGNYAIARDTLIGVRWMSAEEIADAPFSVDRGFIDLLTRF
jgi:hypothetical protein